jgi:hypothetical protein
MMANHGVCDDHGRKAAGDTGTDPGLRGRRHEKVGFSIRPTIGSILTSVLYGWPPAAPPTRIEFSTGYLKLAADSLQAVRNEVRNIGIFTLSGEHTYRAPITVETAERVAQAMPAIFALVDRLIAESQTE